jgi:hypothetical protein
MTRIALGTGDKRGGASGDWQKVKVDRHIVAIAKVNGVRVIYSNDGDVATLGKSAGIQVVGMRSSRYPTSRRPRNSRCSANWTSIEGRAVAAHNGR